jgi:hypothetical protein
MKPEDTKEKFTEGIEHFDEEVPPETNIGGQVRDQKVEAIRRRHELPEVSSNKVRQAE